MPRKSKPGVVFDVEELPSRAAASLRAQLSSGETVLVVMATRFRPNADMPFAWLALTSRQLLLCSTFRRRGVYAAHAYSEINDVRVEAAGKLVRVLLNDPALNDLLIPMPDDATPEDFGKLSGVVQSVWPSH